MKRVLPSASTTVAIVSIVACLSLLGVLLHARTASVAPRATGLALIVEDGTPEDATEVLAWRDAAAEIGVPMSVVQASRLVRDREVALGAALILPDHLHRRMNEALITDLARRVEQEGARLMVVQDAGVADMSGRYADQDRLSDLTGIRYALYARLKGAMLVNQQAWVEAAGLSALRLPPGKLVNADDDKPLTRAFGTPSSEARFAVVGYRYGRMRYPAFVTAGDYRGVTLMTGDNGTLLAGLRAAGRGEVLFVNLPLTYLKLRTDSLFMNRFVRYFAEDIAHLPLLSPMPGGRGALIMNWHIDSGAAVPAMEELAARGGLGQGPYSIHLTAGPDVDTPGDGRGMNLASNPAMQAWVARFEQRGDEVGSHGGWAHNEFGRLVGSQAPERSARMIERNSEVVSAASGAPVREYSAPTGSHPAWVTPWLHAHGVIAYYFTGDIGMPPTRSYQDGRRGPTGIWAFPVLSYGADAAFEEASAHHAREADIEAWLLDVADYCADNRTVRLVYFHPGGIALFPSAFEHWLTHVATLKESGALHWTTMASYAAFATRRVDVQWTLSPGSTTDRVRMEATHVVSLADMSWLFPTDRFVRPVVVEGDAVVDEDGRYWRVVAGASRKLVLEIGDHEQSSPTVAVATGIRRGTS